VPGWAGAGRKVEGKAEGMEVDGREVGKDEVDVEEKEKEQEKEREKDGMGWVDIEMDELVSEKEKVGEVRVPIVKVSCLCSLGAIADELYRRGRRPESPRRD
jgi:hypothetical protein